MSKLSDSAWINIRIRYEAGESIRQIARDFGIVDGTIRKRAKDENWVICMRDINHTLNAQIALVKKFNLVTNIGLSMAVDIVKNAQSSPDSELKSKILAILKLTPKDILDMMRAPQELNLFGDENKEDEANQPLEITFVKKVG